MNRRWRPGPRSGSGQRRVRERGSSKKKLLKKFLPRFGMDQEREDAGKTQRPAILFTKAHSCFCWGWAIFSSGRITAEAKVRDALRQLY